MVPLLDDFGLKHGQLYFEFPRAEDGWTSLFSRSGFQLQANDHTVGTDRNGITWKRNLSVYRKVVG